MMSMGVQDAEGRDIPPQEAAPILAVLCPGV